MWRDTVLKQCDKYATTTNQIYEYTGDEYMQ